MFLRPSLLTLYAFLKHMYSSRIDFSLIGIYFQLLFKRIRSCVFLYLYNSYHTICRSHLSQLLDEFSSYRHSMSINITLKYAFSLKNIVLNYLTHITEFIYPLLEKKNYTNAIARDTKVRISTGRIIQIRRRIINTN